MKLLIRSTSFLMQNSNLWSNKMKFNFKFGDYGNLFKIYNYKKKVDFDISVIFLQDLLENYRTDTSTISSNKKKIKSLLNFIKKKISYQKNINHIFFTSSYIYFNHINTLRHQDNYKKDNFFFINTLYNFSKKYKNIYIVNLDEVFSITGYNNCFDSRNYSISKCHLSLNGVKILISKIIEIVESFTLPKKKVLLLDCDNTLWGGVLGEEGAEKIQLGQDGAGVSYQNFQKAIKKIKDTGILLVLLSKNNEKDIKNIFKKHSSMILKNSDITLYKVNWEDKSKNIKRVSEELSLDISSFVLWDDNPIEREKVRANFREIDVIEPEKEISSWAKQLLEYNGFSKYYTSKDDSRKTEQYRSRNLFLKSKYKADNEILFLKQLKIKPSLEKINRSNIGRAVQLSNKTNQFNFNSKRLDEFIISNTRNQENYLISLKDDFGNHGYVGLINLKFNKNFIFIDQFVVSCRVLGRYLENWMLNEIVILSKKKKIDNLIFEYLETNKNQVTKNFIKKNNFIFLNKNILNHEMKKKLKEYSYNKKSKLLKLPLDKKIKNLEIYGF